LVLLVFLSQKPDFGHQSVNLGFVRSAVITAYPALFVNQNKFIAVVEVIDIRPVLRSNDKIAALSQVIEAVLVSGYETPNFFVSAVMLGVFFQNGHGIVFGVNGMREKQNIIT
jgi:hypothetical protein